MNEELQKALTEILNKAIETTGTATDFMLAEIPDVVQQLLMWKMMESLIGFVICGIVIVAIPTVAYKVFKHWEKKNKDTHSEGEENLSFLWLLFLILPFSIMNLDWLQIWIAPKVYLLEYVADMVSK